VVLMNPPFDVQGTVRASPDRTRRAAHLAAPGTLSQWCRGAAGLLRPGGKLGLIHRGSALPDLLAALAGRFGDIRIVPVHPALNAPASRLLLRAIRGSRAGVLIMPGIVLHEEGGAWTEVAEAILRGGGEVGL